MKVFMAFSALILCFVIHGVLTRRLIPSSRIILDKCFQNFYSNNCSEDFEKVISTVSNKWCCIKIIHNNNNENSENNDDYDDGGGGGGVTSSNKDAKHSEGYDNGISDETDSINVNEAVDNDSSYIEGSIDSQLNGATVRDDDAVILEKMKGIFDADESNLNIDEMENELSSDGDDDFVNFSETNEGTDAFGDDKSEFDGVDNLADGDLRWNGDEMGSNFEGLNGNEEHFDGDEENFTQHKENFINNLDNSHQIDEDSQNEGNSHKIKNLNEFSVEDPHHRSIESINRNSLKNHADLHENRDSDDDNKLLKSIIAIVHDENLHESKLNSDLDELKSSEMALDVVESHDDDFKSLKFDKADSMENLAGEKIQIDGFDGLGFESLTENNPDEEKINSVEDIINVDKNIETLDDDNQNLNSMEVDMPEQSMHKEDFYNRSPIGTSQDTDNDIYSPQYKDSEDIEESSKAEQNEWDLNNLLKSKENLEPEDIDQNFDSSESHDSVNNNENTSVNDNPMAELDNNSDSKQKIGKFSPDSKTKHLPTSNKHNLLKSNDNAHSVKPSSKTSAKHRTKINKVSKLLSKNSKSIVSKNPLKSKRFQKQASKKLPKKSNFNKSGGFRKSKKAVLKEQNLMVNENQQSSFEKPSIKSENPKIYLNEHDIGDAQAGNIYMEEKDKKSLKELIKPDNHVQNLDDMDIVGVKDENLSGDQLSATKNEVENTSNNKANSHFDSQVYVDPDKEEEEINSDNGIKTEIISDSNNNGELESVRDDKAVNISENKSKPKFGAVSDDNIEIESESEIESDSDANIKSHSNFYHGIGGGSINDPEIKENFENSKEINSTPQNGHKIEGISGIADEIYKHSKIDDQDDIGSQDDEGLNVKETDLNDLQSGAHAKGTDSQFLSNLNTKIEDPEDSSMNSHNSKHVAQHSADVDIESQDLDTETQIFESSETENEISNTKAERLGAASVNLNNHEHASNNFDFETQNSQKTLESKQEQETDISLSSEFESEHGESSNLEPISDLEISSDDRSASHSNINSHSEISPNQHDPHIMSDNSISKSPRHRRSIQLSSTHDNNKSQYSSNTLESDGNQMSMTEEVENVYNELQYDGILQLSSNKHHHQQQQYINHDEFENQIENESNNDNRDNQSTVNDIIGVEMPWNESRTAVSMGGRRIEGKLLSVLRRR